MHFDYTFNNDSNTSTTIKILHDILQQKQTKFEVQFYLKKINLLFTCRPMLFTSKLKQR